MLPVQEMAEFLLKDAEECNPGAWVNHSRVTAQCAERIARECEGMDSQKAYMITLVDLTLKTMKSKN